MRACRVGAETLLKVYGVKVDPEEFAAFAGMGEVQSLLYNSHVSMPIMDTSFVTCRPRWTILINSQVM